MNGTDITDSTFPSTFEDYLARWVNAGVGVEDHLDDIREMYQRERLGHERHPAPADMPPCPSWCQYERNHRYETLVAHDLTTRSATFERFHEDLRPEIGSVSQEETWHDGRVTLGEPRLLVDSEKIAEEGVTATDARQLAAELLAGADLLDELAR